MPEQRPHPRTSRPVGLIRSTVILTICTSLIFLTYKLLPQLTPTNTVLFTILFFSTSTFVLYILPYQRFIRKSAEPASSAVYSLDHARLNIDLPAKSMWMNMGYWKDTNHFPTACEALLKEVLKAGGLLPSSSSSSSRKIRLLDLGFGCGDQTIFLTRNLLRKSPRLELWEDENDTVDQIDAPLIDEYVGITLDPSQYTYAESRLRKTGVLDTGKVQIYQADAAQPLTWPVELLQRMETLPSKQVETWVLALDTLYHFHPSRASIFSYAHNTLRASILSFDLLLADNSPLQFKLLLCLLARVMGCPWTTFKTEQEYRSLLLSSWHSKGDVEIRDISEYVFAPLAAFLEGREKQLNMYGWGLGKLKAAKWLFGWWGRSGVVRGVIVVARKGNETKV